MKRLKILLQSNFLYLFLCIVIIIYVLVRTNLIHYKSRLGDVSKLDGIIVSIKKSEDMISFILKTKEEKVRCSYYFENNNVDYSDYLGKTVHLQVNEKEISNSTIPNTFNYRKYLANNGIYKNYVVTSIEVIKGENFLWSIKNTLLKRISSYPIKVSSYLSLFIIGDKTLLDDQTEKTYQSNGIWHLFAISGMHISLILFVLNKLLSKIKLKNIIISSFLILFMFFTGFSPSVMRVGLFYIFSLIIKRLNIVLSPIKTLFLVAFFLLLSNPFFIFNTGFQYSFVISFALFIEKENVNGSYIKKLLIISIIAWIASLPITININYEINLVAPFLNIIFVPLVSLIIFPMSIITFLFKPFSVIFNLFIFILEKLNTITNSFKVVFIPGKMFIVIIILYYVFLFAFTILRKKSLLLINIVLVLINLMVLKINNSYRIFYLDVGQGDSITIITPSNNVNTIDTGGAYNSKYHVSDNILHFYKSFGISKIDNLILSHGDYDHMGETINLVNNFKVEKVIFNCGEYNDLEKELIKVLDKKKINHYSCIKELNIDKNKLYFLQTKVYDNENDNSNVIYTELNSYKFMFMGDASVTTEKEILDKYNLSDIDVLKVGHHGSRTSSSKKFINEISPKYSVISVGKNNRYGHPNKEVLNNLKESKIYRTDEDGSIMFKIKNNKLKIETCSP